PAGSSTRHGFTYTFYPWKGAIFSLGVAASEINCLTSIRTSNGFPPMTEISGIPAYNPLPYDFFRILRAPLPH
ncbi:hypothetical protein, partial [Pseudomonas amygdali]|uniref:hypothetical protein n=1 Tax=Pseudomonas amygdali TaxID=47877 RepID=UPI001956FBA6